MGPVCLSLLDQLNLVSLDLMGLTRQHLDSFNVIEHFNNIGVQLYLFILQIHLFLLREMATNTARNHHNWKEESHHNRHIIANSECHDNATHSHTNFGQNSSHVGDYSLLDLGYLDIHFGANFGRPDLIMP